MPDQVSHPTMIDTAHRNGGGGEGILQGHHPYLVTHPPPPSLATIHARYSDGAGPKMASTTYPICTALDPGGLAPVYLVGRPLVAIFMSGFPPPLGLHESCCSLESLQLVPAGPIGQFPPRHRPP